MITPRTEYQMLADLARQRQWMMLRRQPLTQAEYNLRYAREVGRG